MRKTFIRTLGAAAFALSAHLPAHADLPSTIAVTTYPTTAGGFAQMVAIGAALQS